MKKYFPSDDILSHVTAIDIKQLHLAPEETIWRAVRDDGVTTLIESFKAQGILGTSFLSVMRNQVPDSFTVMDGGHRYMALKNLDHATANCLVFPNTLTLEEIEIIAGGLNDQHDAFKVAQ